MRIFIRLMLSAAGCIAACLLAAGPALAQITPGPTTINGAGGAWSCGTGMSCTGHVLSSSGGSISPGDVNIGFGSGLQYWPNDSSVGTTLHRLVKINSAGNAVITSHLAVLGNTIGVCVAGCGTTGNATVAWVGNPVCDFDGATTAGHNVIPSTITDGECHDNGYTSNPTNGDDLGTVASTQSGAGTYAFSESILGVGATAKQAATLPGGTSGQFQVNTGSGSFGGVAFSGDMTATSAGATTVTKTNGVAFGACANGCTTRPATLGWPDGVEAKTYTAFMAAPAAGTVASVVYQTGGTSSPGFTLSIQINGTPISGCTALSVGTTLTTATCTGLNAFPAGARLTGVVSSITGTTSDAAAQLNIVWGG